MALDIAIGFVILGICILAAGLLFSGRLIARQPSGRLSGSWIAFAVLMFLFIVVVGYIGYASIRWRSDARLSDLGIPFMFFGACLVLAVSTLTLTSMQALQRLTALENETITDSLTGIPNYRYFSGRLNEEVARSNRYQAPLALIIVDVDGFKKINDVYGFGVADLVLIALAKLVLSVARDSDITARYGRDQIAVIAPNTTAADAARFAERILQKVETASLLPAEVSVAGDAAGVKVNIGVSSLGPHIRAPQALIAAANAALLNAKNGRRNHIAVS
jgi:diguanylate cyclase (GGDEF)-like protein